MGLLALRFGPWAGMALLFWLWLGAREDLAAEVERCNTDKMASIAEAEDIARRAERDAADREIFQLRQRITDAEKARQIALQAAEAANARPARVQEVIRRVADENLCLDLPVPADVIDVLRQ